MAAERLITTSNLDDATAAELQKYMEDHGVIDIHMNRDPQLKGWVYTAHLKNKTTFGGGPYPGMSDCMKSIIQRLEEA